MRRRIASLGITEVVSSPLSPWQNPYVERVIGSIRRECLADGLRGTGVECQGDPCLEFFQPIIVAAAIG